jgi:hypothetical protein
MRDRFHDIDDLFYKGISEYSEYPSDAAWNKIEGELDRRSARRYKRKYRKAKGIAAILLLLCISLAGYQSLQLYDNEKAVADVPNIAPQPAEIVLNDQPAGVTGFEYNTNEEKGKGKGKEKEGENIESYSIQEPLPDNHLEITAPNPNYSDYGVLSFEDKNDINDETALRGLHSNDHPTLMSIGRAMQKDVSLRSKPAISGSGLKPLTYSAPRSANKQSRFDLSAYFLPGVSWSNMEDVVAATLPSGGSGGSGSVSSGGSAGLAGGGRSHRDENSQEMKQSEYGSMVYATGLKLGYTLWKKLSVETGLNYHVTTTDVQPRLMFAAKDVRNGNVGYRFNSSSGFTYLVPHNGTYPKIGDSAILNNTKHSVSYVGIPLSVRYKIFSKGKFTVGASAGAQVNILVQGKSSSVLNKGTASQSTVSARTQGLLPVYYSALTGISGELELNKKLSVTLSPTGQFGLTTINEGSSVKSRQNSVGVAAGVKLKL